MVGWFDGRQTRVARWQLPQWQKKGGRRQLKINHHCRMIQGAIKRQDRNNYVAVPLRKEHGRYVRIAMTRNTPPAAVSISQRIKISRASIGQISFNHSRAKRVFARARIGLKLGLSPLSFTTLFIEFRIDATVREKSRSRDLREKTRSDSLLFLTGDRCIVLLLTSRTGIIKSHRQLNADAVGWTELTRLLRNAAHLWRPALLVSWLANNLYNTVYLSGGTSLLLHRHRSPRARDVCPLASGKRTHYAYLVSESH